MLPFHEFVPHLSLPRTRHNPDRLVWLQQHVIAWPDHRYKDKPAHQAIGCVDVHMPVVDDCTSRATGNTGTDFSEWLGNEGVTINLICIGRFALYKCSAKLHGIGTEIQHLSCLLAVHNPACCHNRQGTMLFDQFHQIRGFDRSIEFGTENSTMTAGFNALGNNNINSGSFNG